MATSQYSRYMITKNKSMIEIAQIKMNYPTSSSIKLPSWQINYERYGGIKAYTTIRNMYWNISSYYIGTEGKHDATNFPLMGYEEGITKLLTEFRKDLIKPIRVI